MSDRITLEEALEGEGYADIMELMEESLFGASSGVPALCDDGCTVEPDGTCFHGHPSALLAAGMI